MTDDAPSSPLPALSGRELSTRSTTPRLPTWSRDAAPLTILRAVVFLFTPTSQRVASWHEGQRLVVARQRTGLVPTWLTHPWDEPGASGVGASNENARSSRPGVQGFGSCRGGLARASTAIGPRGRSDQPVNHTDRRRRTPSTRRPARPIPPAEGGGITTTSSITRSLKSRSLPLPTMSSNASR